MEYIQAQSINLPPVITAPICVQDGEKNLGVFMPYGDYLSRSRMRMIALAELASAEVKKNGLSEEEIERTLKDLS